MERAEELLDRIRALGITLQADGARLRFHPRRYVSGDLLNELRAHKPKLLALLRTDPGASTVPTYTNSAEVRERTEFVDRDGSHSARGSSEEMWWATVEALNKACPPGCTLTELEWQQLDGIERLIESAAATGDLVASGAELDAYERTAREMFRKWTGCNATK